MTHLVERLTGKHKENLRSVVLYGSAIAGEQVDDDEPKNILVVLGRITPRDLKEAHELAEDWRRQGNPPPIYFTSREVTDSSDVFPMEFIDMSRAHRVLYGESPFDALEIDTQNLRHQLEYELRGKLLRLRTLYIPASANPARLAQLMTDSLDTFAILFRHALEMLGSRAPFDARACALKLAELLKLDKSVLERIFDYDTSDEVWLESDANEIFGQYLNLIERIIDAINDLPVK